jgi:hypothetical protein
MQENEKTRVQIGNSHVEVIDPRAVQYVAADCYTEVRVINGQASVSFASLMVDGDGPGRASVVARLRFPPEMIVDLAQKIGVLVAKPENLPKA